MADLFSAHWGTWGHALVSGCMTEADLAVEGMVAVGASTDDPMLRLGGLVARGQTTWHRGRLAEARRDLERAAALADASTTPFDLELWLQHPGVQARGWLALTLVQQGHLAESDAVASRAGELAEASDHRYTVAYFHIVESLRRVMLRDPEAAVTHAGRALDIAQANGFLQLQAFALFPFGWGVGRTGDVEQGVQHVTAALEAFRSLPDGHMFGPLLLRLLADLHLRADRPVRARELLDEALVQADRTGEHFDLVEVRLLRATVLDALGEPGADDERRRAEKTAGAHGAAVPPLRP